MRTTYAIPMPRIGVAVADTCPDNGFVWITRINVPLANRGKGYGSMLLRQICDDADYEEVILKLEVKPYGDLTASQLQDWYERFGFWVEGWPVMTRYPGDEE